MLRSIALAPDVVRDRNSASSTTLHWLTRSTDAFPILGEMYKCARCDESFFCTNCLSSHPHTFFVRLGVTPSTARREIKVY